MIKIAIVDDDKYSIKECEDCIHSMKLKNLDIIDTFTNGEDFLNEILVKKVQYDIVILDIDMPDMNGFEVAEKINELKSDIIIMFYTAHEQYVFKAYEYQPFRYIRKLLTNEELPFTLKQAIQKIQSRNVRTISIKNELDIHVINISDIVALEHFKNYIEIYINNGTSVSVRKTLNDMHEEISDDNFVYISKGVIVNLKYVKSISSEIVTMKTGTDFSISRRKFPTVKEKFYKYIGDNL